MNIFQPLHATDRDIRLLVHHAKTTSEGAHPFGGNYVADVLDALIAIQDAETDDQKCAAVAGLFDISHAFRSAIYSECEEPARSDTAYDEWRESA